MIFFKLIQSLFFFFNDGLAYKLRDRLLLKRAYKKTQERKWKHRCLLLFFSSLSLKRGPRDTPLMSIKGRSQISHSARFFLFDSFYILNCNQSKQEKSYLTKESNQTLHFAEWVIFTCTFFNNNFFCISSHVDVGNVIALRYCHHRYG